MQCLSVTTLAAASSIYKWKSRYHRLLYGVVLDFDSRISLRRLRSGDMAVFASLDDLGRLFSTENTPAALDTARIDIVYEAIATVTSYF